MIPRGMEVIDIAPEGYANFSRILARVSANRPRAVLWHTDGVTERLVVDGERAGIGVRAVRDARESARDLHARLAGRASQVVVTDRQGWLRMCETLNLLPRQGELKYVFQDRLNRALTELNGTSFAIYPELSLDRGPVAFRQLQSFFTAHSVEPVHVVLGVFDKAGLHFSFVARLSGGMATQVTSFDHWPGMPGDAAFNAGSLKAIVQQVERTSGPVACGLYMTREDFEKLYDGSRHSSLPFQPPVTGGRAFGISNLPVPTEDAWLNAAALFAYVPVFVS